LFIVFSLLSFNFKTIMGRAGGLYSVLRHDYFAAYNPKGAPHNSHERFYKGRIYFDSN